MLHSALWYARANRPRFVRELVTLCEFPSTSQRQAESAHRAACAGWLAGHLRGVGFRDVRLEPGETAPIVHAEWRISSRAPWLLVYGHYDVQPAEPLAEWRFPPFRPTLVGDRLYGRGTTDDKGQFFLHLKALESWSRTAGQPPVNVRFVLEGEEESGSRSLLDLLNRAPREYAANVAVISDTRMPGIGRPSITYSLRGAITLEVEIRRAGHELHSGTYGGAAHDPAALLARWVGGLRSPSGRVQLPGFYDGIATPAESERRYLARHAPSDAGFLRESGSVTGAGERGFSMFESSTLRPSLSVTGLAAGFTGAGGKSAIPASATARLNVRLVPGQEPTRIVGLVREHVRRSMPEGVHARVSVASAAPAFRIEPSGPAVGAAARALEESFGQRPVLLPSGGTIPVAAALRDNVGADVILMGFGVPGDNRHAPNEFLHLPTFSRGVETSIRLLQYLADRPIGRSRRVARLSARRLYQ